MTPRCSASFAAWWLALATAAAAHSAEHLRLESLPAHGAELREDPATWRWTKFQNLKSSHGTKLREDPPTLEVDIVIPVGLQEDAGLMAGETRPERDRENGELKYTLRSIAKNAPWVHKIYLLANGAHPVPADAPEPGKTVMVDRCTLLPSGDCPTRNAFAVQTVVAQVPGLAEHFIYVEDDDLLLHKTTEADFFADGKPRYWREPGALEPMYQNLANTKLTEAEMPKTMCPNKPDCTMHVWVPLTKSLVQEVNTAYPTWEHFVQSHTTGRYSSRLNEVGTEAAEDANSMEENAIPYVYWPKMRDEGKGVLSFTERATSAKGEPSDGRIGEYTEAAWHRLEVAPPFFQNINDDLPSDPAGYETGRRIMTETLERMLPDPNR